MDYSDKIDKLQNVVIPALEADRDNALDTIIVAAEDNDIQTIRMIFAPLSSSVAMIDGINEVINDLKAESTPDNAPVEAAPEQVAPAEDTSASIQDNSTAADGTQPAVTDPSVAAPVEDTSAQVQDDSIPAADPSVPASDGSVSDPNAAPTVVQDPNQPSQ